MFARTTIRGRLENKILNDTGKPSFVVGGGGSDKRVRSITPRHFSLSLAYRPSHSSRGGRKIKERGLEKRRGEKSAAKRHRYIRHYACFSHACANILLVPKWLFHGERRALRSSRKRRATKLDEEGNGGDSRKIPLATLTIVSPLGGGERTREWRERERGRER